MRVFDQLHSLISAVAGAAGGGSLTFAEIAHLVAANVDEDHDGNLTVTEIYDSIVLRFDHDGKLKHCRQTSV